MILTVLAFLGGVLTIFSPCILPVLPFVLARADQPFLRSGLPLLLGMALAFTGVASLAAVGGGWAIEVNHYGRLLAMGLLAFFALTLLLPGFAERLARPVVALGARLSLHADSGVTGGSFVLSMAVGVATGFLWAPCAGPVLGLVLTAAAIRGPSVGTSWLLLTYAAGAATSMALALLLGRRVHAFAQRSLAVSQWARRTVGVMVLAGVAMIAAGLDTGLFSQLSLASTTGAEQKLIDTLKPKGGMPGKDTLALSASAQDASVTIAPARRVENPVASGVKSEGQLPPLDGATGWLNSAPLIAEALRGKVVLVDFWTYSCINCLRTLPYIRAWAEKYRAAGLVVVGVHSPEFAFEKDQDNVRRAVKDLGITYPVAIDSRHAIWRAFGNQYWPALYFVDAQGRIRHHVFGEGQYTESERMIQKLLAENGTPGWPRWTRTVFRPRREKRPCPARPISVPAAPKRLRPQEAFGRAVHTSIRPQKSSSSTSGGSRATGQLRRTGPSQPHPVHGWPTAFMPGTFIWSWAATPAASPFVSVCGLTVNLRLATTEPTWMPTAMVL